MLEYVYFETVILTVYLPKNFVEATIYTNQSLKYTDYLHEKRKGINAQTYAAFQLTISIAN